MQTRERDGKKNPGKAQPLCFRLTQCHPIDNWLYRDILSNGLETLFLFHIIPHDSTCFIHYMYLDKQKIVSMTGVFIHMCIMYVYMYGVCVCVCVSTVAHMIINNGWFCHIHFL